MRLPSDMAKKTFTLLPCPILLHFAEQPFSTPSQFFLQTNFFGAFA